LKSPISISEHLYTEGFAFDFFQAVRLLQWIEPHRPSVGRNGPPSAEPVRFRAHISLAFPPSSIHDLAPAPAGQHGAVMIESFLGLAGPNSVLPRHYTELLLRLERDQRGPERRALRDWFDLFNHRLVSHFYRAWEKYRFYLFYERGGFERPEPDPFTQGLLSFIGLGTPALRNRIRIEAPALQGNPTNRPTLARVDDLALLYYSGLLAHRPRSAAGLQALLRSYFRLEVEVFQFQGQWLQLEPPSMTRIGLENGNNRLGVNALAGERVWDVQSKFRLRVGPLSLSRFQAFLPSPSRSANRNAFFLLTHLTRFYVGPELDFEIQLVLKADEVPDCQLPRSKADGPTLGWNSWLRSEPFANDTDDAVFPAQVLTRVDGAPIL
jgi:type VI secretion system protein ImpH